MNTNPKATTVLCYGDSNTYGQEPDNVGRYSADIRWTGKLQTLLGNDYYVIEEGLGGRTTNLEHNRKSGRNGKEYLLPCLNSHSPLDIVIVMLGTNDLKIEFSRSPAQVAQSLKELVAIIQANATNAAGAVSKIILVSPILIDDTTAKFKELYPEFYNHESAVKSQELGAHIQALAEATDCIFIDAASVARAGADGLHFDVESNAALAELLAKMVKELA